MIERQRRQEFEQMVKFACGLVPNQCTEKNLAVEIFGGDEYYFFTSWLSDTALRTFLQSEEFFLIRTAFDTMGALKKIEIGYDVEIKTIHINQ